jgi:transposase
MGTPRFAPEFREETVRQKTVIPSPKFLSGCAFQHSIYKWLRAIKPDNSEQHIRD